MRYNLKEFFKAPTITRTPEEIKQIRIELGKSQSEFADLLRVGTTTVRGWESDEGTVNHREPDGPALLLLYWLAEMANQSPSRINNMIRQGSRYSFRG